MVELSTSYPAWVVLNETRADINNKFQKMKTNKFRIMRFIRKMNKK